MRRADAAARRCARAGRPFEVDVERAKAALWRRLFGAELSPELVGALCHVDVRERLVRLTNGGWVRDDGDCVLASGADPRVVAIMVEAAKSKGWRAVSIWGDQAFLAESRRQFEAAGIPVTVVEPPPPAQVERDRVNDIPEHDPRAIVAELQRARIVAEKRLAWLCRPLDEPPSLNEARSKARAADEGLQKALQRKDVASEDCDAAKRTLDEGGFRGLFGRGAARQRATEAQRLYDRFQAEYTESVKVSAIAAFRVQQGQHAFEREVGRRRADRAVELQRAHADVAFAVECEVVATESSNLARQGIDAVESAARARLNTRATASMSDAVKAAEDELSILAP